MDSDKTQCFASNIALFMTRITNTKGNKNKMDIFEQSMDYIVENKHFFEFAKFNTLKKVIFNKLINVKKNGFDSDKYIKILFSANEERNNNNTQKDVEHEASDEINRIEQAESLLTNSCIIEPIETKSSDIDKVKDEVEKEKEKEKEKKIVVVEDKVKDMKNEVKDVEDVEDVVEEVQEVNIVKEVEEEVKVEVEEEVKVVKEEDEVKVVKEEDNVKICLIFKDSSTHLYSISAYDLNFKDSMLKHASQYGEIDNSVILDFIGNENTLDEIKNNDKFTNGPFIVKINDHAYKLCIKKTEITTVAGRFFGEWVNKNIIVDQLGEYGKLA